MISTTLCGRQLEVSVRHYVHPKRALWCVRMGSKEARFVGFLVSADTENFEMETQEVRYSRSLTIAHRLSSTLCNCVTHARLFTLTSTTHNSPGLTLWCIICCFRTVNYCSTHNNTFFLVYPLCTWQKVVVSYTYYFNVFCIRWWITKAGRAEDVSATNMACANGM